MTEEKRIETPNILLETERLLLRCPEVGDNACFERLFCDPGMMYYLGGAWEPDKTIEVLQEWRESWGINHIWCGTLLRKDTMQPVGTAGVTENTLADQPGFELSWFVLPEQQGQGFASEITTALLGFVFETVGAKRVVAETHPQNPASNHVLQKLGFECLGEQHHTYDDLPGFDTQVLWVLTYEHWLISCQGQ